MSELEAGDRIRVLASKGDLEGGRKGTVVNVQEDGNVEVRMDGNLDDYLVEAGNLERVRASTGSMEMTRALYGVKYVRSGTPEELLEVEGHLRQMIDEGMTPLFMMRFLMTYGYLPVMIRKAFQNLTGLTIEDAVNEGYTRAPGCIPNFTMAWGKGKGNKGWYFIMPIADKYCIFNQVDDMNRDEVSSHKELVDAIDALKKVVVKVERWNPPVKETRKDVDATQLYRQPQLFLSASALPLFATIKALPASARAGLVRMAFRDGEITKEDYDKLIDVFADAEEQAGQEAIMNKLQELEKSEMQRPLSEDLADKTPEDFFKREELEGRYTAIPADVVNAMSMYLEQVNNRLKEFSVRLRSFKYTTLHPSGRKVQESDEPDLTNSVVSIAVILDIVDHASPSTPKQGGIVFSVIGNKIWTTDTLKGLDGVIYGLSDEGLNKYFQKSISRG